MRIVTSKFKDDDDVTTLKLASLCHNENTTVLFHSTDILTNASPSHSKHFR